MNILFYIFIGLFLIAHISGRFISENEFNKLEDESKLKIINSISKIRKFYIIPLVVFLILFIFVFYKYNYYSLYVIAFSLFIIFIYMIIIYIISIYKLKIMKKNKKYIFYFFILGVIKYILFFYIIISLSFFIIKINVINKNNEKGSGNEMFLESERFNKRIEAKEWFKNNKNQYSFASNRFGENKNAEAFINNLYDLGAKNIFVTNIMEEDWRIKEEGGPYADSLIVILPNNKKQRKEIFKISSDEAIREGFAPENDTCQIQLFFWWD